VSDVLRQSERLREGLSELIEQECAGLRGDPKKEARVWAEKLSEADRQRSRAQDLTICGLMSHDELRTKLAELENTRAVARRELEMLKGQRAAVEQLEQDRDAVMASYAGMVPPALESACRPKGATVSTGCCGCTWSCDPANRSRSAAL
jgi:hypothetical protein